MINFYQNLKIYFTRILPKYTIIHIYKMERKKGARVSRFPISENRKRESRIFFQLFGKGTPYTKRIHYSKSSGEKYYRESEFEGTTRGEFCIHRRGAGLTCPSFWPCDKFASVDAGIEFPVAQPGAKLESRTNFSFCENASNRCFR